ncbi:GMC family oxidoreductase [Geminicoccus roseus]|uniref:GMC family oxidoreductase n=1 Tax=Geminicoccus roseus TaxID=404900 RepID=UPI000427A018|nr:choline dehydrogenase [Geminicoccus roseus]
MTDYIIVGAGSAGCVLANRLSADPAIKVVVLEAGGPDRSPFIHMPAGYRQLMMSGAVDWGYHTVPQKHCGNRTFFWPRGKVLGGSSSINGMVYIRGHASDFDVWAQKGNPGWSYADVLPYFKRAESWELGEDEFHGGSGPLRTSRVKTFHPLAQAFFEAGQQAGYPRIPDVNVAEPEGFGPLDSTIADGRRSSTAYCYLRPAMKRPNLTVITRAHAARVIVEGGRATGVEYIQDGQTRVLRAEREVILSGGAINSPQLLQLSGIGDAEHLRSIGIKVVHDLKGVGQNLSDHVAAEIQQVCRQPISLLREMQPLNMAKSLLQYAMFRTGPVAHPGIQAVGFIRTRSEVVAPDVQIHFIMVMYGDHGRQLHRQHGYQPLVNVQRPASLGTVLIRSDDPLQAPAIDPNYLAEPEDVRVLRDGIKLTREILAQKAFDPYRGEELTPGPGVRTDAEIDTFLRHNCHTQYHPVGTCKMGPDPLAVVDQRLRVHGLDGLRVVDASIMPVMVSANTNAATIMIAEKGADMIQQDASGQRADAA